MTYRRRAKATRWGESNTHARLLAIASLIEMGNRPDIPLIISKLLIFKGFSEIIIQKDKSHLALNSGMALPVFSPA